MGKKLYISVKWLEFLFISLSITMFLLGLQSSVSAQLADSSWPMFGYDIKHTGRSHYSGPLSAEKKWEYDMGKVSATWGSPAIGTDGTIYIGSADGRIYAMDTGGTVKWYYETAGAVCSTPAIGLDGTVYITSNDGFLYAITSEGALKWKANVNVFPGSGGGPGGSPSPSPAIISDGTIYICGGDGLYALYPGGGIKWKYETTATIYSSPAVDSAGTIYFATSSDLPNPYIYAINPNGTLKWKYGPEEYTWFYSSPAIGSDGTIYIGDRGGKRQSLFAINQNGTLKWRYFIGAMIESTPAIAKDGTIYIATGTFDHSVYAINPDGTLKWTFARGGVVGSPSSPAIGSDGTIYIGSADGNLYAISPEGGCIWNYNFTQQVDNIPGNLTVFSPIISSDGHILTTATYLTEYFYAVKLYAIGAIINQPSTANDGPDQTINEGATITLDGSNSSDPESGG